MQGGIHYFGRGVPLLSLLEAVIHEDSEGILQIVMNRCYMMYASFRVGLVVTKGPMCMRA